MLISLQLELVTRIGLALLQIQKTEMVLKLCVTQFLGPKAATLSEWRTEKLMIGQLLKAFRKRTQVAPEFDEVLEIFLNDRNILVHDVERISGFAIETEQGLKAGIKFVNELTDRAAHVRNVIMGFLSLIAEPELRKVVDKLGQPLTDEEFHALTALLAFRVKHEASE